MKEAIEFLLRALKVSADLSFSGPPGVSTHVIRCNGEWRDGYRNVGVVGELYIRF